MTEQPFLRQTRWWYWLIPGRMRCKFCDWPFGVEYEDSRTAYFWDGNGEDPNKSVLLCRQCAEAHHSYWDEMWAEYNYGRI